MSTLNNGTLISISNLAKPVWVGGLLGEEEEEKKSSERAPGPEV